MRNNPSFLAIREMEASAEARRFKDMHDELLKRHDKARADSGFGGIWTGDGRWGMTAFLLFIAAVPVIGVGCGLVAES